jgi:hypothetical protein
LRKQLPGYFPTQRSAASSLIKDLKFQTLFRRTVPFKALSVVTLTCEASGTKHLSPTRCGLQAACHRNTYVLHALAVFCLSSARNRNSLSSLRRHGPSVSGTGLQSAAWQLISISFLMADCTTLTVAQPTSAQVAPPRLSGSTEYLLHATTASVRALPVRHTPFAEKGRPIGTLHRVNPQRQTTVLPLARVAAANRPWFGVECTGESRSHAVFTR